MAFEFPEIRPEILFLGVMMMLMNVGSRYIIDEFSSKDEDYHKNVFIRRIAIFAVCYMGTRDIVHALLLTAGFVTLAMGISRTHPIEGFKDNLSSPYENLPALFSEQNESGQTQPKK